MIDFLIIGQPKPQSKITFRNGWQVVMQLRAPLADNGNVSGYSTDASAYAPDSKSPEDNRHALTPDNLILFLAHIQAMR
jgi:hypothetical protein